jgi:hypothetical protein
LINELSNFNNSKMNPNNNFNKNANNNNNRKFLTSTGMLLKSLNDESSNNFNMHSNQPPHGMSPMMGNNQPPQYQQMPNIYQQQQQQQQHHQQQQQFYPNMQMGAPQFMNQPSQYQKPNFPGTIILLEQ